MVIKLYISGISGNKEVKKKQQRVQMILDSKQISYEAIDITEPGKEKDKEFMQANGKVRENLGKHPLPPQIFNDENFCGDYEDFDLANEVDELEKFLHIATNSKELENGSKFNEDTRSMNSDLYEFDTTSQTSSYDPYEYHTFKIKWDGVNGLEEEIIVNTDNLIEDSEKGKENPKSEVNGESKPVPASESSNENIAESKSETSTEEVPAPADEEEVPAEEKETVGEEENVTETPESGVEVEEDTKRVEKKEKEEEKSEKPKEESEAKKGNEEELALEEGNEVEENVGNENKGEGEKGEKEEKEGDDEEQEEKKEEEEEEGDDD